jgi:mono/diheme cytochrome c family protein
MGLTPERNCMRPSTRTIWGAFMTLTLMIVAGRGGAGQQQQQRRTPAPSAIPSMSGGDLFGFYCASCHGRDGKGNGPVASALIRRPPDLTTIARANGGRFPTERVESFVTGNREPTLAHGPTEMPVWGPIFQALDPQDRMNRIRIENVVAFIQSIQAK